MIFKWRFLWPLFISPLGLLIPLAPRSGPLWVLLLGIAGLIHYLRYRPSVDWLRSTPIYVLGAFLTYASLSAFWSVTPERSFEQAFRLSALAFFGLAAISLLQSINASQSMRLVGYLLPGLIIGIVTGSCYGLLQYTAAYLEPLVEFLGFGSEIIQFKYQRLNIAKVMLVSNLAFFAMLPWLWQRQKTIAILAHLAFLTVCFYSDSQSSFVACIAAGTVFYLSKISAKWVIRLFSTTVIAGFLLTVPLTQSSTVNEAVHNYAPSFLTENASVKLRLKIYQFFGEQALTRPALGHGLEAGVKYVAPGINYQNIPEKVRTPHSVFLQIIFDLGYLGAALTLLVLLLPIRQIYISRGPHVAAALLLPICVVMAGTLFNFVIWRTWILGAAVLAVLFILIQAEKTCENIAD